MKTFWSFVKKESLHILRDPKTLFILLGMPLAQILIFGFALTNEVKNSKLIVVDQSKDAESKTLVQKIDASKYFDIHFAEVDPNKIDQLFKASKAKIALVISSGFGEQLLHSHSASVQIICDASDPNTATAQSNYLSAIIGDFQKSLLSRGSLPMTIKPEVRMLYNPQLKGVYNFVPGVMAMILLLICTLMTSVSIVKEKELGTMEVLLTSPLRPALIIAGKVIPYLVLSMGNISTILLLSYFVFDMPVQGSIMLLYFCSFIFILTALILGVLISTITDSQMTAMFISMVGMFLPTIMLSGFMFPIENMPKPLQFVSNIVPAKYYYIMVKNVMIKGLGFAGIYKELGKLFLLMSFFLIMSIRKFKIRLA